MKKMCAILAMLTAFSAVGTIGVFAEEVQKKLPALEQAQKEGKESQYTTMSGTIQSIEKQDKDTTDVNEAVYSILISNDEIDESGVRFVVNASAFVINSKDGSFMTFEELKPDMKLTAVVAKNAPMTMSLPPMINPIGFVVGEDNFVTTGYFDEELTSQDAAPMLQLNLDQQTKIVNQAGARKTFTAEDVKNQDCLVVYGATTRSIPAQTTPVFTMILDTVEPEEEMVEASPEEEMQSTPLAPKTEDANPIQDLPEVIKDKLGESQYKIIDGKIDSTNVSPEKTDDRYTISVSKPQADATIAMSTFTADANAFFINGKDGSFMTFDELQDGMQLTAILAKNAPSSLHMPAVTKAVGFVVGEENFVTTGYFDEELTSQDTAPMLQLNLDQQTKIVNQTGARKTFTTEDVKNQDCLVVYGATTRSIPAQTTPVLVMILDDIAMVEPEQTEEPKTEPSPDGNFVPLRELAESKGYTVTWTANDKPVTLQKEDVTIEITVGQKEYKKNGETLQAQREAKLMQSKIYISENIL